MEQLRYWILPERFSQAVKQRKCEQDETQRFMRPWLRISISQREIEFYTVPSPAKRPYSRDFKRPIYKHVLLTPCATSILAC